MNKAKSKGPVVIEMDKKAKKTPITPAEAPAVIDIPTGAAMQTVTRVAARKSSRLAKLFWGALVTLMGFMVSLAFWDFVTGLLSRNIWLGRGALGLVAIVAFCLLIFALRELAALSRLRRIDTLRQTSERLQHSDDLNAVRNHADKIANLLAGRDDIGWALAEFKDHKDDQLDASGALEFTESTLMTPLDALALKEIEQASRMVATATALVPLALADVVVALTANIRMIRRIAEVYGGRAGSLGSWRLMRAVAGHLVATGAVAIGDDMLGSIAGGGVLSKVSRRFGEGLVNGALTARVGIAATEVCRPMPYRAVKRPKVTNVVKRALTGLMTKA
jgi:putative membrane protein